MAPSSIRKALGAVKDQTSIGLAKVSGGGAMAAELDVAIVKATKHSESIPSDERHVREILSLTCYSRAYVGACVASLSRRLGRTRSWAVALKTLVLVHRLLLDGDPAFEQEVFFATRRGTRMLNMSDFCDRSRADAWDFSAFVRTYAAYLDDRLDYRMQGRRGGAPGRGGADHPHYHHPDGRFYDGDERGEEWTGAEAEEEGEEAEAEAGAVVPRGSTAEEARAERFFMKMQHLQHLLDRFLACRPTGVAKTNRVVAVALYPLVKESFQIYCELTELMAVFIDGFTEFDASDCARIHAVFSRLAKQLDELDNFYSWCKAAAICRPADFPEVEPITQKKLDLMDEFIRDRCAPRHQQRLAPTPVPSSPEETAVEEYDMNAIKALPAPEEPHVALQEEDNAGEMEPAEPDNLLVVADDVNGARQEADFLNLKEDIVSGEEHGQKLALALFDGNPAGAALKWEAFDESSADWETALVQSASRLAIQQAELGGGFNMMVLDGMYGHATANAAATSTQTFTGSASSVAVRPPGAPMLALPAPPGSGSVAGGADPFAASLVVPPPAYVQMSDMQTKQRFLAEEQVVWRQYGRDGMQGQGSLAKLEQQKPQPQHLLPHDGYNYVGGYNRTY